MKDQNCGEMKLIKRCIVECHGYCTNDNRSGSHITKPMSDDICQTLTTLADFNKLVLEVYDDEE